MEKRIKERMKIGRWLCEDEMGTLSPEHRQVLERWLQESSERQVLAEDIKKQLRKNMGGRSDGSLHAWERFLSTYPIRQKRFVLRQILKYAAVIAIPLLSCLIYFIQKEEKQPGQQFVALLPGNSQAVLTLDDGRQIILGEKEGNMVEIEHHVKVSYDKNTLVYNMAEQAGTFPRYNAIRVPRCGEYRMTLSDGSVVVLNSESTLRYPVPFSTDKRDVWLEGEAWFEVVSDRKAPFTVHFDDGEVRVLGTHFNIEAYRERGESRTTLVEGAVRCSVSTDSCILSPGHQAILKKGVENISVEKVDLRVVTAWVRGQFYFKNERLENIMDKLSRWYGVEVVYSQSSLKELVFTVETNRFDDMNNILDLMAETESIKYKQQGRTITLYY